jgi:signal transduction histidine kinase
MYHEESSRLLRTSAVSGLRSVFMLHHFLANNRDELAKRCRVKVGNRPGRSATEVQLQNGIPLLVDQLIRTLRVEQSSEPLKSELISGPAGGGVALSEVGASAAQHGKDLLGLGLTVDQVVHDYGDLCQSITDLAVERDAPFSVDEFRTLNRCLDNAISDAVTEFSFQRDGLQVAKNAEENNQRMGFFVHELRNLLGTASLAFAAAEAGNLSLTGATGSILKRSLSSLHKLITATVEDVRIFEPDGTALDSFSLAEFIAKIYDGATLSAKVYGCSLRILPVDIDLAVQGTQDLLIAAVANLLQNAFKFTQPGSEVLLTAYAQGDRILIDVKDHCGGLRVGSTETIFLPFSQAGTDRTGIGLGLTIARKTVEANKGTLTVHNIEGIGCVFTINLPRHSMPT